MKKLALALMMSSPLLADPILQDAWNGSYQIQHHTVIGQSFIADDATIASIGISAATMNAHTPFGSLTFNLFQGTGFGGALLGTAVTNPVAGTTGWSDADFSSVNLVVGQQYTFQVASTNLSAYWGLQTYSVAGINAYAGGNLFIAGNAVANADLRFRVTPGLPIEPPVAAVPEPSTAILLGLGCLSFLAFRRRRAA